MFGSIGFPELILIFIVVLLVFGPRKLPEFATWLGKIAREFRATVEEAKSAVQDEMTKEGMTELKDVGRDLTEALSITHGIDRDVRDALHIPGVLRREAQNALDDYGKIDVPSAPEAGKTNDEKKE